MVYKNSTGEGIVADEIIIFLDPNCLSLLSNVVRGTPPFINSVNLVILFLAIFRIVIVDLSQMISSHKDDIVHFLKLNIIIFILTNGINDYF